MKNFFQKSFFIFIFLLIVAGVVAYFELKPSNNRLKLYSLLLTKPLAQIKKDYQAMDCRNFSATETKQGYFEALVTGYCKPAPKDFASRQDFLCAVGLNCACPSGADDSLTCSAKDFSWNGCKDFNDQKIAYCNLTAAAVKPQAGQVAADWKCFAKNSEVTIDGRKYTVTDKGSQIIGRRFDIWFENCQDAFKAMGIYRIKLK